MIHTHDGRRGFARGPHAIYGLLVLGVSALGFALSASADSIAFCNGPFLHWFNVPQKGPLLIATVSLDVAAPSSVLVQFSAEAESGEQDDGCPCTLRAFLQEDNEKPIPVKRINIGSPFVTQVGKYEHDRQELTGSYVFLTDAGSHRFRLIVQQLDGTSRQLKIDYPNLQAIVFGSSSAAPAASQAKSCDMPNMDHWIDIEEKAVTPIESVTRDIATTSDVRVEFSAYAQAGEKDPGCPCTVQLFLQMDDNKPQPIKQLGLGSEPVPPGGKYDVSGSYLFPAVIGRHRFTLLAQQVVGKSHALQIDRPNLQVNLVPK